MQAAIGCAQLKKFPTFVERRRHNFDRLRAALSAVEEQLILPEPCPNSKPSLSLIHISFKLKVEAMDFILKDEPDQFEKKICSCLEAAHTNYYRHLQEMCIRDSLSDTPEVDARIPIFFNVTGHQPFKVGPATLEKQLVEETVIGHN